MAPTAAPKPASGADDTVRKQLIIAALRHRNSIQRCGLARRPMRSVPKLVVVDPAREQDQIQAQRKEETTRRVPVPAPRRWRVSFRVPSSTEDGLAAMMDQLKTSTPGSGDHAAVPPAPAVGEMFDKME